MQTMRFIELSEYCNPVSIPEPVRTTPRYVTPVQCIASPRQLPVAATAQSSIDSRVPDRVGCAVPVVAYRRRSHHRRFGICCANGLSRLRRDNYTNNTVRFEIANYWRSAYYAVPLIQVARQYPASPRWLADLAFAA